MNDLTTLLGGLSVETFLREYWQKKPLLVRQAIPGYRAPITPEELAGLACEPDVESRLVMEKGGPRPWHLEHGPFDEARFPELPRSHWTLLVQEINKHVPDFALLQERFGFIPGWRLDDVMVSFAADQGSVGPHADTYDVFLLQGHGRRRWQINETTPREEDLIPDLPLRIMREFDPEQGWELEPGDMLYLPPGVAHHGVALGECITVSIGFRAPQLNDIVAGYVGDILAARNPEAAYRDPDLVPQPHPGEITEAARRKVRAVIRSLPTDDAGIDRWFGRFITDVRPGHYIPEPEAAIDEATLLERLRAGESLWRSEFCRFAHILDAGTVWLYVAGEEFSLPGNLAPAVERLTDQRVYTPEEFAPFLDDRYWPGVLTRLYNDGCLYFPDDAE